MLNAEGPEAFEDGFRKLQEVFEDDEAKVGYITELYNDADKAHFKRELIFTNGVLVDLCETLFNAVKVWVYGSARNRRTTLLMALVRIVRGVYEMIVRDFLHPVKQTRRIASSQNVAVARMFRKFADKLTKRAVKDMFESLDRCWLKYQVFSNVDKSITLTSQAGDEFAVLPDFSCSCEDKPCWQQQHTGLLCNHALIACVQRLQEQPDKDEKEVILDYAVAKCNKNWRRSTYARVNVPYEFTPPTGLTFMPSARRILSCRTSRELDFITRFREVLQFVSVKQVETLLHELESHALSDVEPDEGDSSSSTDSEGSAYAEDSDYSQMDSSSVSVRSATSSSVSAPLVSNPQLRRTKRARYMDSESE